MAFEWSKVVEIMSLNRNLQAVLLSVVLLSLTGCVSLRLPKKPQAKFQTISKQKRRAKLEKINRWNISGAFSIQQQQHSTLANFNWRQFSRTRYRINIASALNLYQLVIVGKQGLVTLWRSSKKHISARSPEQLLRQAMGWSLPISNLYYWVRGLPAPGSSQSHYDRYGHLIGLRQQGWTIHLRAYRTVNGVDLPRILQLQRPGLASKIVIKHWQMIDSGKH